MSAPLKVYTRPDDPGHSRPSPQGCYVKPAIQVPIEDESLPHPGDGREWETTGGIPVTVIGVDGGHVWLRLANGARSTLPVGCLRERKPEPEHRPWCKADAKTTWQRSRVAGHNVEPLPCICERRSGEDRREGERRSLNEPEPNYVATAVRNALLSGRRSGKDRRQS